MAIDSWLHDNALPRRCDGEIARVYLRSLLASHLISQFTTATLDHAQRATAVKRGADDLEVGRAQEDSRKARKMAGVNHERSAKKTCLGFAQLEKCEDSTQVLVEDTPSVANANFATCIMEMRHWREQSGHLRVVIDKCRDAPTIRELSVYQNKLVNLDRKLTGYLASHQMVEAKVDAAKDVREAADHEVSRRHRCLAALTRRMGLEIDGQCAASVEQGLLESDEMAQEFLVIQSSMVEDYKAYIRQSEMDLEQASAVVGKLEGELCDLGELISITKCEVRQVEYVVEFLKEMSCSEAMAKEILTSVDSVGL